MRSRKIPVPSFVGNMPERRYMPKSLDNALEEKAIELLTSYRMLVVSWDHHTGLMRDVRPYEILDNELQKVRKMPHEKA